MSIPNIGYNFNGKNISNDAGALSVENFLTNIRLKEKVESIFKNTEQDNSKRGPKKEHTKAKCIFDTLKSYIKGYENPTELSRIKKDPFAVQIGKDKIASQSTYSRFITGTTKKDIGDLKELHKAIIILYLEEAVRKNGGEKLDVIEIDDDSTKIETHGKQEGGEYIAHYKTTGYHPDLITDNETGLVLNGMLRKGQTYSSKGSEQWLKETIELIKPYCKKIIFRGDSAYSKPEIYNELRRHKDIEMEYYIKAKTYSSWIYNLEMKIEFEGTKYYPLDLPKEYFENENGELIPRYITFYQQCKKWENPEKVVAQIKWVEKDQATLFTSVNKDIEMLIVGGKKEGKVAFAEYAKRGRQEKTIEEVKNDGFVKNLSSHKMIQNEMIFLMKIIAYNLMQILRLETLYDTRYATSRISTVRRVLVNIGGKIVRHAKKIIIQIAESFAYKKWYDLAMQRIANMHMVLT